MSSNNDNNSEVAIEKAENNDKGDSKVEKGAKRPSEDKGVDPKKAKTALNGDEDEVEEEDEDVDAEEEEEEEEDIPDGEEEEDEGDDGEGDVEGEDDEEDQ